MSRETSTVREALAVYATEASEVEHVPPGYRQTEVGVIPEDWEVRSVQDIGHIKTGPFGTLLRAQEYSRSGGVPLISVREVGKGTLQVDDKTPLISPAVIRRLPEYVLNRGDIVFGRKGAVDRSALVLKNQSGWFLGSDGIRFRPTEACHPPFVLYQFQRKVIQSWLLQHATGTTMATLNQEILRRVSLPLPSLREQRAIAAALSDVDALIAALDKLIAKKRAVKTAAMQQLLTGKQRLPGFSGEWEVRSLEEVADVDSDNLTADTDPDYQFNYISLEDVDRGALRSFSHQRFSSAPSRARRQVRSGDILVSTVRPNLKSHLLFSASEGNWVCSTGFSLVRCRKRLASPGFVYQHLFHGVVPKQIEALIAGSNYPAISAKDVRAFQIPMPSIEVQTAIATVLSDMDAEISTLEARREKTRQVKQGMMQELLTGRIRLKDKGDGE